MTAFIEGLAFLLMLALIVYGIPLAGCAFGGYC